jgi:ABC-2 type transport system ATP-binding protein
MITTASPATLAEVTATSTLHPAVDFESVSKQFGSTRALDGVTFRIPVGSTVALLGPNGAGKSTAIHLMLNLLQPGSGTVRVLGLDPSDAIASGRVGAMLQDGGMPAGVQVDELVRFSRALYPRPISFDAVLAMAGLTGLAGRRVETLSGGETQRLRFALAITGDPDLVFLDEPTVAMDVEGRRAFWDDMRHFAEQGRTVLFATHYLEEADHVADRIVVLDHGRVVADGTPGEIKGSVSTRTVRFTLADADRWRLNALPGVVDAVVRGAGVTLTSSDADATIRAVYQQNMPIRDLEVTGAGLEDAFVALTADR